MDRANGRVVVLGRTQSISTAADAVKAIMESGDFEDGEMERVAEEEGKLRFRITCKIR
jgi:hypothetical protein